MTTTVYEIDLHFHEAKNGSDILNSLCFETVMTIEENAFVTGFTNTYFQTAKGMVFAEVQINTLTRQTQYFVAAEWMTTSRLPALNFTTAALLLNSFLA